MSTVTTIDVQPNESRIKLRIVARAGMGGYVGLLVVQPDEKNEPDITKLMTFTKNKARMIHAFISEAIKQIE
jgi:hypothetical protein